MEQNNLSEAIKAFKQIKTTPQSPQELKVGDRVVGRYQSTTYLGTVFEINTTDKEATIERDDHHQGCGVTIPEYGQYSSDGNGWKVNLINKDTNKWGGNGLSGELTIITKT